MSIFSDLKRTPDIKPATDRNIGGGRPKLTSGVHTFTIEMAYVEQAASGAIGVYLKLVNAEGITYTGTEWVRSGNAKGNKHYYSDKDGNQQFLPGFIVINDITRLTAGQELFEMEPEDKTVMVYNYELQKEVPASKAVLLDIIGKEITVGVRATLEDQYKDPTKFRTVFSIDKVFDAETGCTVVELESEMEEGNYINTWKAKNTPTEDQPNLGTTDKRVQSKNASSNNTNTASSNDSTTPFSGGTKVGSGLSKFGKKV